MKRLIPILAVFLAIGGTVACHHVPPTITTDAGKRAFTADEIAVRVNELQKAAIQAEATNGLSTPMARAIVRWSVSAAKILKATPTGWQATIVAGWLELKQTLGAQINPVIIAVMSAVDVTLASLGGQ